MAQADEFPPADELKRRIAAVYQYNEPTDVAEREGSLPPSPLTPVSQAAPAKNLDPEYQKILGGQELEIQNAKAANQAEQQHLVEAAKAKAPLIEGLQKEIQGQLDNPLTPPTAPQFGPVPNQG